MFNFKKERLVKDSIGQGSFGEVFPYQKNSGDSKWVVKRTKAKKIEDLLRCLPEIVLGFSCDHPCIVPVKGYSIEQKDNKYYVYLKLPRMSGGNLADELKRRNKKEDYFCESELVKHFYSLASAVDYLHNKKISHGDIKINNILMDDKGNLKLCDIGSGKFVPDDDQYNTMTSANGAINYKAPEIIQHERALKSYKLKSKSEKKDQPMEIILKKDHLYLADSWSLGLTMLELCMLEPRLINPYDSVQLIEENFQKIKSDASTRYSDILLKMVFDLLKTDPTQRFKISIVKRSLEENFKQILTEDFKASLGLQKKSKQDAPDIFNYLKIFHEKADVIMKAFEDDKKAKDNKLNKFEETLDKLQDKLNVFKLAIEKIKAEISQEVEVMSKKYEESIQILKQENLTLIEKLEKKPDQTLQLEKQQQVAPPKPRDEEAYRNKLEKVSAELNKKWNEWIDVKSQPHLSISIKYGEFNDQILKDIAEDIVSNCCKEDLWEEMDRLDLMWRDWWWNALRKITDEGLKMFASQLGPRLSNLKWLSMDLTTWLNITDDGLKEFASQIAPSLTNLQHLELHMPYWKQVTDKGLEVFILKLTPNLTNIKHLVLDIGNWPQISDHGLTVLGSQLGPKLVNMTHVDLRISGWENITDDGVKVFASQLLPHLVNVSDLRLCIGQSEKITDEGIKALASQFGPKHANVNSLELDFFGLQLITSQSLQVLAHQITQNLTKIQQLALVLEGCPLINKSDAQNLRNQLKKIPNISIYPYE